MFDAEAARQYQHFLEDVPPPTPFTTADLESNHPFATVIHRRSESLVMIGTAWGGREYTKRRTNENGVLVSMEFDTVQHHQQGISVSAYCCYKPQINGGLYPNTNELIRLGFVVREDENLALIQGREYPLIRCFNRSIDAVDVSVGEALRTHGKDDRLLIDEHFTAHFNNTQHCHLVFRKEEEQAAENFTFINQNRQLLFGDMFARGPWSVCELAFVKIPSSYLSIILAGKQIDDVLDSKGGNSKKIIQLLQTAFMASYESASGDVNALIERCVAVKDVATLPLNIREAICDVFEENIEELFGMDCTEFFDVLQPQLLAQGDGGGGSDR